MGIMPALREAGTDIDGMTFVNDAGCRVGHVNFKALQRAAGSREVELPRGDLASILYRSSQDSAEYLFDDTIVAMSQDAHGVDVTFDRSQPRRFDLVVGADGLHSAVRRLAFGPERDFVQHMGVFIATMPFDGSLDFAREVVMHNAPGRAIALHPSRGGGIAAFMFRGAMPPGFDHRDTAQHKMLLENAFRGGGWRVPELLDRMRAVDDLYFDSVSRVRMPHWSRGRVTLVGDAASCVSLFGEGSSLAMAGAFTLAESLTEAIGEAGTEAGMAAALARYEKAHRVLVEPKQRAVSVAAALMVPASRPGIVARNIASRLWPVAAAAQWTGRRLARSAG